MPQKARFTPEQKRDVVLTLLAGQVTMAELCREHQVSSTTIYNWREAFLEAGVKGLAGAGPSQREARLERENARLKEIIGDISVANHLLKGGTVYSTRSKGGRV